MKDPSTNQSDEKFLNLNRFIAEKGKDGAIIAFSGGVDSATLASVCREVLGEKAVAVAAKSPTYSAEELIQAKEVAKEIGIKIFTIETKERLNENFIKNPENRCTSAKENFSLNY